MGNKKCVKWGFGYGESEYEVSFGLAPRNGELSPSEPKTPEPFNFPFRAGTRNGVQIRTPRKIWGRYFKTWGPGAYIPRDKRSMVKLKCFFDFRGGEIGFFLTCQLHFVSLTAEGTIRSQQ